MSDYYNKSYFTSNIFENDYDYMASIIYKQFKPKNILEIGCGQGQLSKAFAKKGVHVLAIDGYAQPDFSDFATIEFKKIDLNNIEAADDYFNHLNLKYDLAISMEVAEHLIPSVNKPLIHWLTKNANNIIFSSAVVGQGGDGHINCQPREYWIRLFASCGFHTQDTLRSEFRKNEGIRPWYQLNVLDFQKKVIDSEKELIERIISADSYASSMYYQKDIEHNRLLNIINLPAIQFYLKLRNSISRLLGRKTLNF